MVLGRRILASLLPAAVLLAPNAVLAGPDEDVRDAARAEAQRLRADGWPQDQCFAGLYFLENVVARGNGDIQNGDTIQSINTVDVSNAGTEALGVEIRKVSYPGNLTLTIERQGEVLNIEHPCQNSRPVQEAYLTALDFAGRKKWYDCIDALATRPRDPQFLALRIRCAAVSRKSDNYPIQDWKDSLVKLRVEMGDYAPASREEIAQSLLKARIDLSPGVYRDLVDRVIAWDNGTVWGEVQPDYRLLRSASERGVLGRLIDPNSAIIELPYDYIYGTWTSGFGRTSVEGFITCGTVNARNRMGGYTGSTYFVSVVNETGIALFTDMDSSSSPYFRPVDQGCSNLVPKLSLVKDQTASPSSSTQSPAPELSLAEQLATLADLYASGALSKEEYDAAKARVIAGN
jgi:Short C-terminal domain